MGDRDEFFLPNLLTQNGARNAFEYQIAILRLSENLSQVLPALNISVRNDSVGYLQGILQLTSLIGLAVDFIGALSPPNATSQANSYDAALACWQRFDAVLWVVLGGFILLPVIVLLGFTLRRKQLCLDRCDGRFGVVYPWETLKYTRGRCQCSIAILLLCYPIFLLLTESSAVFNILTPSTSWATTPLKLGCMVVAGISLHPIFFSITKPSVLTLSIGLVVSVYYAVVMTLPSVYCATSPEVNESKLAMLLQFAYALPSILAALCVALMLFIDFVRAIKSGCWLQSSTTVVWLLGDDYHCSKERYVKLLLMRSRLKTDGKSSQFDQLPSRNGAQSAVSTTYESENEITIEKINAPSFWTRFKYQSVVGFYYPNIFLCSFSASVVLIYYMVLVGVVFTLDIQNKMDNNWFGPLMAALNLNGGRRSIDQVFSDVISDQQLNWSLLLRPHNLIPITYYCFDSFVYVSIAACVLATVNGLVALVLMFFAYRENTIDAYRGIYRSMAHRSEVAAGSSVVGQCRYGGYQIAYCAWGLLLAIINKNH